MSTEVFFSISKIYYIEHFQVDRLTFLLRRVLNHTNNARRNITRKANDVSSGHSSGKLVKDARSIYCVD